MIPRGQPIARTTTQMTGCAVGNIMTSLVWLRGSDRFPVREVSQSPCTPSEHPLISSFPKKLHYK